METLTAFSILLSIVLFCFLIAAIFIYSKIRKNLSESSSLSEKITDNTDYWKVVKGVVTESKLDYKDSKGLFNKTRRAYRAHFSYEYYAYNQKYTHSSLLLTWTPSKKLALEYVNRYPLIVKLWCAFIPSILRPPSWKLRQTTSTTSLPRKKPDIFTNRLTQTTARLPFAP